MDIICKLETFHNLLTSRHPQETKWKIYQNTVDDLLITTIVLSAIVFQETIQVKRRKFANILLHFVKSSTLFFLTNLFFFRTTHKNYGNSPIRKDS